MRSNVRPLLVLAIALVPLAGTACLPYTVGSTAQTVPAGRTTKAQTSYFIPNAVREPGDTVALAMAGVDLEWRHGLDVRSDVGFRVMNGGVVVNYKRRVGRDTSHARAAVAFMTGAGIVNWGEHAHFEATLLASGRQDGSLTPFGGLRAMQVVPITIGAVRDSPSLGGFAGLQIGDERFSVRPEIGVYYDRSTLGLRSADVIVVPAVTLQRGRRR